MKKILFTLFLILLIIPAVNADETYTTYQIMYQDYIPITNFSFTDLYGINKCAYCSSGYVYNNFDSFYQTDKNKEVFDNLYLEIMDVYSTFSQDYPDYLLSVLIKSTSSSEFKLEYVGLSLNVYNSDQSTILFTINNSYYLGTYYSSSTVYYNSSIAANYEPAGAYVSDSNYYVNNISSMVYHNHFGFSPFYTTSSTSFYLPTLLFESSFDKLISGTTSVWEIYDADAQLIDSYSAGDALPALYQKGEFGDNYSTVNLSDYYAVILTLKDYSQTESFSSVLKVKGSLGITPVYNFGTAEKTEITDRCNSVYSDYTNYRFYILKDDLANDVIYYFKSCSDNTSFKYDSSLFDVTYVTEENKANPIIKIDGKDYNVIPFDQLSNSSNENEQNNYIPGENGSSVTDVFSNITGYISSFWNSLTTFMSLVTKFFNTLPIEIRAIAITTFATGCTLGLIKIIKS